MPDTQARGRGVQSVEVATAILAALARHGAPMSLNALAKSVGMPAAKCHRYLASFITTGMVQQRATGSYDLGPLAAEVGVAAVARNDLVNHTADALVELVEQTHHTAQLSVWGNRGPTIIRWERAARMLITTLGLGSTLPLLRSATGQVFLAFSPRRLTADLLRDELQEYPGNEDSINELIENLRKRGLASVDQQFIPGLHAIAAPVLNWQGEAQAVVTLIASEPQDQAARDALLQFTRRHGVCGKDA